MHEVVIAGWAMTTFGKHPKHGIGDLASEAVLAALSQASIPACDIGFVAFANVAGGASTGQNSIRGQAFLGRAGLQGAPIVNTENACASGGTAVHLAWLAVSSGQCEAAIAVGSEKMHIEDRETIAKLMISGVDVAQLPAIRKRVDPENRGRGDRTFLMDVYAHRARRYMERTGATPDDFARVSAKNRAHGIENPRAQFRKAVTAEEVLQSRMINWPLTLLMCSPLSDGAAAIVLTTAERARAAGAASVRVAASALRSGTERCSESAVSRAARTAYELAGIGPQDVDVVELHDAVAPAELMAYEELGLCGRGEGPRLIVEGVTLLGGRTPVNPSGGLLTKGHPVAATGCAQLVELTEQLLGQCGSRQVCGARVALAMNAGGFMGDADPAACTVIVLQG